MCIHYIEGPLVLSFVTGLNDCVFLLRGKISIMCIVFFIYIFIINKIVLALTWFYQVFFVRSCHFIELIF